MKNMLWGKCDCFHDTFVGLQAMNIDSGDIDYVVCTNGHSDKIGNLNLFTKALQIVSGDVCTRDCYYLHAFGQVLQHKVEEC